MLPHFRKTFMKPFPGFPDSARCLQVCVLDTDLIVVDCQRIGLEIVSPEWWFLLGLVTRGDAQLNCSSSWKAYTSPQRCRLSLKQCMGATSRTSKVFFRFIRQKVTSGSPDWYLVTAELIRVESTYWFCPTYCAQSVDGPPFVGIR